MNQKTNTFTSIICAFKGITEAIKNEKNLKIQFSIMLIVLIIAFFLSCTFIEWCILLIVISMVLSCELFNTAIEQLSNVCCSSYNAHIKLVKDIAAGSVLCSSIFASIIGIIIFYPKLLRYF